MIDIQPLLLPGAFVVRTRPQADSRGHFARLWCRDEFVRAGLQFEVVQTSSSFNKAAGTLRGMHFAWPPSREAKLVRCARGRAHDVLLDLRNQSPAFGSSISVVLDAEEATSVFVPAGVAHGFQTLLDDTELHYMMNQPYTPQWADGVRFNDPRFGITWPLPVAAIAERDRCYPDFDEAAHRQRYARGVAQGAALGGLEAGQSHAAC